MSSAEEFKGRLRQFGRGLRGKAANALKARLLLGGELVEEAPCSASEANPGAIYAGFKGHRVVDDAKRANATVEIVNSDGEVSSFAVYATKIT